MFNIKLSFQGMDELKMRIDDVKQKAEELEQSIQRLNEVEIGLKTEFADQ